MDLSASMRNKKTLNKIQFYSLSLPRALHHNAEYRQHRVGGRALITASFLWGCYVAALAHLATLLCLS